MLSHTFTFTAHLASSLRWQFHEDSYIQHKNEQNWLLHKKQMYKLFSPESFIKKKKKKFTVKILPHINSAVPSFPSSKSELTYSKQFRCQPQSSIISTTDWQWRSPNVHKLSTPFFFPGGIECSTSFPSILFHDPVTKCPRPPRQIPPVELGTGFCVPLPKNSGEPWF